MVVAELLEALGFGGRVVLLAMAAVAVWHFRSGLQFASNAATVTKIAVYVAVGLFAMAILIPGISVSASVSTVTGWGTGVIETVAGLLEVVV